MSETLKPLSKYLVIWLRGGSVKMSEFDVKDEEAAWAHVDKNYPRHVFFSLHKLVKIERPKKN